MPQFDFNSFPGQTFWTLTFFLGFYFIALYFYIPFLSEVIKLRKKIFYLSTNTQTNYDFKRNSLFKIYSTFTF